VSNPWPLLVQYDDTVSCSCNIRTRRLLHLCSFRVSVIETRCIPNTRGIRAAFSVEVPIGGEVCLEGDREARPYDQLELQPGKPLGAPQFQECSWPNRANLVADLGNQHILGTTPHSHRHHLK
jgi:hypothetical protein